MYILGFTIPLILNVKYFHIKECNVKYQRTHFEYDTLLCRQKPIYSTNNFHCVFNIIVFHVFDLLLKVL